MRNIVFFEALAATVDLPDERERETLQKELTAAIIVLRLFADWVDSPAVMIGTPGTLANIKAAVADVAVPGIRQLLETVVAAVSKGFGNPSAVAAPLLAYAWMLEERGVNDLAEDVLRTVADAIEPLAYPGDYLFVASLNRRLGDHAHGRRDLDSAEFRYRRQLTIGQSAGDVSMALNARIHLAGVQLTRGNLGVADAMLAEVAEEAHQANNAREEAYARRARGTVMMHRGEATDALREYYRAYRIAVDWIEREWLLGDMAGCAVLLGFRRLARIVYTSLAETAHTPAARSLALTNLLEVAVLDRDRDTFMAVSRQLRAYELPRQQEFYVKLVTARGVEQWEGEDPALVLYQSLVAEATQAGLHDIAFTAEAEANRLLARIPTTPVAAVDPPAGEWAELAKTLEADCRLLQQSAGVPE